MPTKISNWKQRSRRNLYFSLSHYYYGTFCLPIIKKVVSITQSSGFRDYSLSVQHIFFRLLWFLWLYWYVLRLMENTLLGQKSIGKPYLPNNRPSLGIGNIWHASTSTQSFINWLLKIITIPYRLTILSFATPCILWNNQRVSKAAPRRSIILCNIENCAI